MHGGSGRRESSGSAPAPLGSRGRLDLPPSWRGALPSAGTAGAGAVFLSGCTLRCSFCQNHQISRGPEGGRVPFGGRARRGLPRLAGPRRVQRGSRLADLPRGPPHGGGVIGAREGGLRIPVVWKHERRGLDGVPARPRRTGGDLSARLQVRIRRGGSPPRRRGAFPCLSRGPSPRCGGRWGPSTWTARERARRGVLVRHLVLPRDAAAHGACPRPFWPSASIRAFP